MKFKKFILVFLLLLNILNITEASGNIKKLKVVIEPLQDETDIEDNAKELSINLKNAGKSRFLQWGKRGRFYFSMKDCHDTYKGSREVA